VSKRKSTQVDGQIVVDQKMVRGFNGIYKYDNVMGPGKVRVCNTCLHEKLHDIAVIR
jgi:hypothetical protein